MEIVDFYLYRNSKSSIFKLKVSRMCQSFPIQFGFFGFLNPENGAERERKWCMNIGREYNNDKVLKFPDLWLNKCGYDTAKPKGIVLSRRGKFYWIWILKESVWGDEQWFSDEERPPVIPEHFRRKSRSIHFAVQNASGGKTSKMFAHSVFGLSRISFFSGG